jgi:hypothetical protein
VRWKYHDYLWKGSSIKHSFHSADHLDVDRAPTMEKIVFVGAPARDTMSLLVRLFPLSVILFAGEGECRYPEGNTGRWSGIQSVSTGLESDHLWSNFPTFNSKRTSSSPKTEETEL